MILHTRSSPLTSLPWATSAHQIVDSLSLLGCFKRHLKFVPNWALHIVPHTCSSDMSFRTRLHVTSIILVAQAKIVESSLTRPCSLSHWTASESANLVWLYLQKHSWPVCTPPPLLPTPWSLGFRLAHLDIVIVHNWFPHLCYLTHPVILLCQSQRGSGNNCLQPNWRDHWHICKYGRQNPKHSCLTVS